MNKLILKRDITQNECEWLPRELKQGETVYEYTGHTYGCISETGIAVLIQEDNSFYEIPLNSVEKSYE